MSIFDQMWDNVKGAVVGVYDSAVDAVDDAVDSVSDWWNGAEDVESAPQSYQQTAYYERLADGSVIPIVNSAQDADGRTIINTPQNSLSAYQPYLIGGGILVVVLLVVVLMMGRR